MKKFYVLFLALFAGIGSAFAQWDTVHTGTGKVLEAMDFAWSDTAVVVGYDSSTTDPFIYHTTDRCNNWTSVTIPDTFRQAPLRDVVFVSQNELLAVGDSGSILHSADGGNSWTNWNYSYADLLTVFSRSSQLSWVAGDSGVLLRSNGPMNWTALNSPSHLPVHDIFFINDSVGWLTGDGGMIAMTTDSGSSWTFQANPYFGFFNGRGIWFSDTNNGICVGKSGAMLRTTDGGANWTIMTIPNISVTQDLYAIQSANAMGVVICGSGGLILQSTNGGWAWSDQSISSQSKTYLAAAWSADTTAYVCGSYGKMARSNTNISSVGEIISSFEVNAYPNPFSDVLNIRFETNGTTAFSISVYDLSGRMISAEQKNISIGDQIQLESSGWMPGIYFITICSGEMRETIKVVKQ